MSGMFNRISRRGIMAAAAILVISAMPILAMRDDTSKHGPIPWVESFSKASSQAASSKKLMMVDFWAEWCGPCKQMLATTYKDPKVVEKAKSFVPALINVDKDAETARKYNIEAIPMVLIIDAKGKVVASSKGYLTPEKFLAFLNGVPKSK